MKSIKKLSLIVDILEFLAETAEMLPKPFESPYQHTKRMWRITNGIPEPKKWQYNRAIKQLEQRGEVRLSKQSGQIFISLTQKGHLNTLFKQLKVPLSNKAWDGKWRLMIWDIPESSRKDRNSIRWFAKTIGFYQLQKSVFITPYELPASAVSYLKISGLIEFIRFLRVDKIDNETALVKHFNLKQ